MEGKGGEGERGGEKVSGGKGRGGSFARPLLGCFRRLCLHFYGEKTEWMEGEGERRERGKGMGGAPPSVGMGHPNG